MSYDNILTKLKEDVCISLIGMPASGKSTLAQELADKLAFIWLDSDYLIESLYGVPLQKVTDKLSKEDFIKLEGEVIEKIRVKRAIISTGGSAVYEDKAMQHLKTLGPCIFLNAGLSLVLERIAKNPERGLAIAPNQTVEDLYEERSALYAKYADLTLNITEETTPEQLVSEVIRAYS